MVHSRLFSGRVRRMSVLLALVLTLVLAALPTAVMAAPVANGHGYGHGYGQGYGHQSCGDCYVVRKGDTLSQIAKWYGVNVYTLARYNGISNPSKIYVGQHLRIPKGHCYDCGPSKGYYPPPKYDHDCKGCDDYDHKPKYGYGCKGCDDYDHKPKYGYGHKYHVVRKGDTLSQIAKWYGVSTHYLARKNHISNPSKIYVGQVIYL